MGKIAFVFSGQGAQFAGMGKDFYEGSAAVRSLFDSAEQIRPGTLSQCFEGDAQTLKLTENTQPCLYLSSLAGATALGEAGIKADAVAGFSLGEIAALAYAGAYGAEEGFRIVCRRGELMSRAAAEHPAAMLAVVKLPADVIESVCEKHAQTYPVNYNSADQTVVALAADEVEAFSADIKAAGGRTIPLAVSGGFHSPFMDEASRLFGEFLAGRDICAPALPAYSNYTAKLYGDDVRTLLEKQINHPVRWRDIVLEMSAAGIDTFIEVGAGSTLAKLVKKTLPDAAVFSAGGYEDIRKITEAVG